jgi:molybdopterin synthase catalytic subunit
MASVRIQTADFDVNRELKALQQGDARVGAVASFVGTVRTFNANLAIERLVLEHYPGMTESVIAAIVSAAHQRFDICRVQVIHRVGSLRAQDNIVFLGVSAAHRHAAFQACEFVMDYLKTQAPFWKKEHTAQGSNWVDARASDEAVLARWQ